MKVFLIIAAFGFFMLYLIGTASLSTLNEKVDKSVEIADERAIELLDECEYRTTQDELVTCFMGIADAVPLCKDHPSMKLCNDPRAIQLLEDFKKEFSYMKKD